MSTDPKVPNLVWSETTHPDDRAANIAAKAKSDMEELAEIVRASGGFPGSPDAEPSPPAEPTLVDPAAEAAAFAELLAFIKANGEPGDVVTTLSAAEFAEEDFTPPEPIADAEPSLTATPTKS